MLSGVGVERGIDRSTTIRAMASNPKADALIQIKASGRRRDTLGCEPASAIDFGVSNESRLRARSARRPGGRSDGIIG
jgi:hypothetical protein